MNWKISTLLVFVLTLGFLAGMDMGFGLFEAVAFGGFVAGLAIAGHAVIEVFRDG